MRALSLKKKKKRTTATKPSPVRASLVFAPAIPRFAGFFLVQVLRGSVDDKRGTFE